MCVGVPPKISIFFKISPFYYRVQKKAVVDKSTELNLCKKNLARDYPIT